mmetsp:Transcript_16959/g.23432  ORF Transcript_16959/g.23432 Transcript_16959/m.23432 type:complete len:461 (-) Transcript_16959:191-1573(-)|eukprot:CAMPEP_0196583694 /NCGR_PEP_ID=MMETSP1081-20130531/44351_1 /TAXON_ID=36882 /ORGANISM="Pyramimonas amylifera, Strain CCMP720" /LENGTH=460 /DNA_ID=CAMNT_0041904653 /DNA_START=36 /DNA_END=1418 /DNA_ORIENTATION=-
MSSFEVKALADKLGKLSNSQQSIETLSNYIVYHRKRAKIVVSTWETEFAKTSSSSERRLTLIHLANDVLQRSRKSGPEFVNEFFKVIPRAFRHLSKHADKKTKTRLHRLIDIWEERKVFGNHLPKSIRESLDGKDEDSNEIETDKKLKDDVELTGPTSGLLKAFKTLESSQALESRASHVASAAASPDLLSEAALTRALAAGRSQMVSEAQAQAHVALQGHQQALQGVMNHAEHLISLLKQALAHQEENFEATESKLQQVRDQSELLEKLKITLERSESEAGQSPTVKPEEKEEEEEAEEEEEEEGTPEVELYDPLSADPHAFEANDAEDVASSLANMENPAALLRDALTGMSQAELNLFGSSLAQLAASSEGGVGITAPTSSGAVGMPPPPPGAPPPPPGEYPPGMPPPLPGTQQPLDMDVGNESPYKRPKYEEFHSAPTSGGYPYEQNNMMGGPPGFC